MLKETKWKVVKELFENSRADEIDLPRKSEVIKDEDIKEFFECLVFVVDQPRVKELETYFFSSSQDTILEDNSLRNINDKIRSIFPNIYKLIGKKMKTKKLSETWMCGEQIKDFFRDQEQLIKRLFHVTALTVIYESEVMQYGEFHEYGKLKERLDNFIKSRCKFLCVNTSVALFSSMKIMQYLKSEKHYNTTDGRICVRLDSLTYKKNRDYVLNSFELDSINLLSIECRYAVNESDIKELYSKLFEIANAQKNKKIIFIVEQDMHAYLEDNFRDDFLNERLIIHENDSIDLKDYEPKENPFMKNVIIFQEQNKKLNLMDLTGISNWGSFNDYMSQEGFQSKENFIDLVTLAKILNDENIEIGSKPLGTSSLEGAYAALNEEINTKTLLNKLLSQEVEKKTKSRYIISGIHGKNKEEKINNLYQYLKVISDLDEVNEKQLRDNCRCSKIEIFGNCFNEENFKNFCHNYTDKQIFWICTKYTEAALKFILYMFYNPLFYFNRKFKKVIIRKDVKKLMTKKNTSDVFIFHSMKEKQEIIDWFQFTNEEEKQKFENVLINKFFSSASEAQTAFQELCEENQTVHWLKVEEKYIIWCKSHGSVKNLRQYIDKEQSERSLVEEDNLVKEIKDRKVVIIADDPGMGKTSTLTKLYESNHGCQPFIETHWVIKINLRDHLQAISDVQSKDNDTDFVNIVNFLSKVDLKLNNGIAKYLLRIALDKTKNYSKPLLLAFDGFDEVLDAEYRDKIISMLKFLKDKTAAKFWITTRLHYKEKLENELSTFAVEFDPMKYETKVAYIKKYLKDRLFLILDEKNFAELFYNSTESQKNNAIERYTEGFLIKMASVFKYNVIRFIGNPLQLYLMLEGSVNHFINWMEDGMQESPNFDYLGNDVWEVYKNFIDRKLGVYFKKLDIGESVRQKEEKFIFEQYHLDFAKSLILKLKPKQTLDNFKEKALLIGIIKSEGSNIEFVHATFRDYFAAELFIYWLKKVPNELSNSSKQEYLLKEVLMKPDYLLIRTFMNLKLQTIGGDFFYESLEQFGKSIAKFLKKDLNLLYYEARVLFILLTEGNTQIVWFVINSLKEHRDVLEKLLLIPEPKHDFFPFEKTVLHRACDTDNVKIVRTLLDAVERVSAITLQKLLYTCDCRHLTALDEIITRHYISDELMKEPLNRANNKLHFITKIKKSRNSFSLACKYGNFDAVMTFLLEFKDDEVSLKQLLLCDHGNENVLYFAMRASFNVIPILEILLTTAKKMSDNNKTLKKLLLPEKGCLPLTAAFNCKTNKMSVLKMILNFAKDINDDKNTLRHLLLPEKLSILLNFIIEEIVPSEIILLNITEDMNYDDDTLRNLFFPKTVEVTLCTASSLRNVKDAVEMLLKTIKDLSDNDTYILKDFLLPERGALLLNRAVYLRNYRGVEVVLSIFKYINNEHYSLKKLLLCGRSVFLLSRAMYYRHLYLDESKQVILIKMILNAAKDINDDNYTLKKLLQPGRTAVNLNKAIDIRSVVMVEMLLNAAKDIRDNNYTLKKLLLPDRGVQPLYKAIDKRDVYLAKMLLNVAEDIGDNNHTLKQLLLNDRTQKSALRYSIRKGYFTFPKLLLETASRIDHVWLEKLVFATNSNGENAVNLMVMMGRKRMFFKTLKIFKDQKYQDLKKKLKATYRNIPLSDRLYLLKRRFIKFITRNRIDKVKKILINVKQSNLNPNEKLRILLLAARHDKSLKNTLYVACEKGYLELIKQLMTYAALHIDDRGSTLRELMTKRSSENKTPFDALKDGYSGHVQQIVENLICQAGFNKNKHVVQILQNINEKYIF